MGESIEIDEFQIVMFLLYNAIGFFFFTLIEMGEFVHFIGYFNLLWVIIVCKRAKETAKY